MSVLANAQMTVAAAPAAGTVTLGAATPGAQTWAAAGAADGATYSYRIEEGTSWEVGTGTYTAAGTKLARTTVLASSNGNAAVNFGAGAIVSQVILPADLALPVAPTFQDCLLLNSLGVGRPYDAALGSANVGKVDLFAGGTTASGFVSWRNQGGYRLGYMGFSAVDVPLNLENNAAFNVLGGNTRLGLTTDIVNARLQIGFAGGGTQYGLAMRPGTDGTFAIQFQNAAGSQVGSVSETGSAVAFNTASDGRVKPVDLRSDLDPGDVFDRLRPIRYVMTLCNPPEPGVGFVAQDLAVIAPEAVTPGDDTALGPDDPDFRPWSVDLSKLVPLLCAEMKALRQRVAALEARLPPSDHPLPAG